MFNSALPGPRRVIERVRGRERRITETATALLTAARSGIVRWPNLVGMVRRGSSPE